MENGRQQELGLAPTLKKPKKKRKKKKRKSLNPTGSVPQKKRKKKEKEKNRRKKKKKKKKRKKTGNRGDQKWELWCLPPIMGAAPPRSWEGTPKCDSMRRGSRDA